MRRLIPGLLAALGLLLLTAALAWAGCSYIYLTLPSGRLIICETCCSPGPGGYCQTTCS